MNSAKFCGTFEAVLEQSHVARHQRGVDENCIACQSGKFPRHDCQDFASGW